MILRPIKTVSSNNEDESLTSQVRRIRRHRGGAGGIRTHDIRRVPRLRVSSRAPEFPHPSILVGLSHVMDSGARPNAELTTFLERSPGPVSSLARLRPRMGPAMSSCPVPHQFGQGEILVIKPSRRMEATSRSSANLGV